MRIGTWAIGGLINAALVIPAVAFVIGPTTKAQTGAPTLFKAKIKRQAGWVVSGDEISAYILTDDGHDYVALSNICTHLGCRVRWVSDQGQFSCPYHNAICAKDGSVISGPPPRPIDRYEVNVEDRQLFILEG